MTIGSIARRLRPGWPAIVTAVVVFIFCLMIPVAGQLWDEDGCDGEQARELGLSDAGSLARQELSRSPLGWRCTYWLPDGSVVTKFWPIDIIPPPGVILVVVLFGVFYGVVWAAVVEVVARLLRGLRAGRFSKAAIAVTAVAFILGLSVVYGVVVVGSEGVALRRCNGEHLAEYGGESGNSGELELSVFSGPRCIYRLPDGSTLTSAWPMSPAQWGVVILFSVFCGIVVEVVVRLLRWLQAKRSAANGQNRRTVA